MFAASYNSFTPLPAAPLRPPRRSIHEEDQEETGVVIRPGMYTLDEWADEDEREYARELEDEERRKRERRLQLALETEREREWEVERARERERKQQRGKSGPRVRFVERVSWLSTSDSHPATSFARPDSYCYPGRDELEHEREHDSGSEYSCTSEPTVTEPSEDYERDHPNDSNESFGSFGSVGYDSDRDSDSDSDASHYTPTPPGSDRALSPLEPVPDLAAQARDEAPSPRSPSPSTPDVPATILAFPRIKDDPLLAPPRPPRRSIVVTDSRPTSTVSLDPAPLPLSKLPVSKPAAPPAPSAAVATPAPPRPVSQALPAPTLLKVAPSPPGPRPIRRGALSSIRDALPRPVSLAETPTPTTATHRRTVSTLSTMTPPVSAPAPAPSSAPRRTTPKYSPEEQAEIARLRASNAALRERIADIEARIAEIERRRRHAHSQSHRRRGPRSLADETGISARGSLPPPFHSPPARLAPLTESGSGSEGEQEQEGEEKEHGPPTPRQRLRLASARGPSLSPIAASPERENESAHTSWRTSTNFTPGSSVPPSPYAASFTSTSTHATHHTFGPVSRGEVHAAALRKLQGEEYKGGRI